MNIDGQITREGLVVKKIGFLIVLALVLCLFLSAQCRDKGSEPRPSSGLIGTWRWVVSCGGFAFHCIYADSVDYEKFITFRVDSTFIETIDDSVVFSGRFTVVRDEAHIWNDTAYIIMVEGRIPQVIDSLTGTVLEVVDDCFDCFGHRYYRLSPI